MKERKKERKNERKKRKRREIIIRKEKLSLVDVRAVPAFLGVARRHDEAVVANLVR